MNTYKVILLFFAQFSLSIIYCQISLKTTSGREIESINIEQDDDVNNIDSVTIETDEYINTSSSGSVNRAIFNMFLMRTDKSILLNLDVSGFEEISDMTIERKTTHHLSNFRTIKTFTNEEITEFFEKNNFKFEDKFPESNKVDSYYRLRYQTKDGFVRYVSTVKLESFKSQSTNVFGDHNIQSNDDFYDSLSLVKYVNDDFGFSLEVERLQTTNQLKLKNTQFENLEGKWMVERKTSHYLSTFRMIKIISETELTQLKNEGELIILDKNPESRKLTSYYRLKYIDNNDKEFPLSEVKVDAITGGM